jgi:hypothetical protein
MPGPGTPKGPKAGQRPGHGWPGLPHDADRLPPGRRIAAEKKMGVARMAKLRTGRSPAGGEGTGGSGRVSGLTPGARGPQNIYDKAASNRTKWPKAWGDSKRDGRCPSHVERRATPTPTSCTLVQCSPLCSPLNGRFFWPQDVGIGGSPHILGVYHPYILCSVDRCSRGLPWARSGTLPLQRWTLRRGC